MKKAEVQRVLSLIQNLSDYIADAPLNTTTRFHAGWQGRVQQVVQVIQGMVDAEPKVTTPSHNPVSTRPEIPATPKEPKKARKDVKP